MTRRNFFAIAVTGFCLLVGFVLSANSRMQVIFRKIKGRLRTGPTPLPTALRHPADLPRDGERVSVELALNSRCSSDSDDDPEIFHWGMLDSGARLSPNQVRRVVDLADRCRVAEAAARIEAENEVLAFSTNAAALGQARESSMIASGMQQQAVCLTCAALGVGLTFDAQGLEGTQVSPQQFITTKMRLGAMKASYSGSFWNAAAPEKERPWLTGNLPDPKRDGQTPLVTALANFRCNSSDGTAATTGQVSQLLWAARGRTPHLYKSTPWGLTVPTWQGLQNISSVYVAAGSKLYKYVNWKNGRPTHRIEVESTAAQLARLPNSLPASNCFLVLATNEPHARALWEVGYQLLNIIVQASVLGISYRMLILSDQDRLAFAGIPMGTPVAMIGLHTASEQLLESI